MDLNFSQEEQDFRTEVRDWIAANLPAELATKVRNDAPMGKQEILDWQLILHEKGWLTYMWPAEFGGTGWGPVKQFIFEDEMARACCPRILPFGLKMLAPVLMKFGTKEQQDHYLPRMCDGTDWWCQGYSEPGSGSDLASLKTAAVRDGDHYIVNGQKTWTTLGQHADWIFNLVRTSSEGKQQEGISFLLVDMKSPGIEVRPIRTIDGGHEVNEVFFTDVKVPASNLVGEENMGWTYAKYLLTHERTNIAGVGKSYQELDRLRDLAAKQKRNGKPLSEDPLFAARLAKVEIDLMNMEVTNLRVLSAAESGGAPGTESSMLKLLGTEIEQEITDLTRRALGRSAQALTPEVDEPGYNGPHVTPEGFNNASGVYFNHRKTTIYGGSSEIQKNIITKMIVGL
ncbi:acyl-CoA dehydrogenase family protein [Alisedimentitalea sp. MJ-SS2]|uniref:acyl-CoA dehydrogenase family protein n=1 Tax=Aliisedimentitalea sp. MJ-SS2 TaxID=3049795 RepID=UPI0029100F7B|nr:acyl-CoA dehydrogenase family protein [Alisedimentitalea sp. MJ-SS2]MDU8927537.1 acyl-CoA dehydrogenase family protein [Alisedimentitalea sp. MJ-SS2]